MIFRLRLHASNSETYAKFLFKFKIKSCQYVHVMQIAYQVIVITTREMSTYDLKTNIQLQIVLYDSHKTIHNL